MRIGSWNVRGLESQIKRDEVYKFFEKNKLDFCCLQETKMEAFSDSEGKWVWKDDGLGGVRKDR